MKVSLLLLLTISFTEIQAQYNDCQERIANQAGSWKKATSTESVPAPVLAMQKKFTGVVHSMLQGYAPKSLVAEYHTTHERNYGHEPVNVYSYTVRAFPYVCNGAELQVPHESSNKLVIFFNRFFEANIYDTPAEDHPTGYFTLRHGLPVEVQPGIWQFEDDPESMGFGVNGTSRLWLLTYPGQLPWKYVTRREFLMKRLQVLQDKQAIDRVKQQLQGERLDQPAIVIQSTKNYLDYDFTDKVVPFAQVLIKPNPGYFNKTLNASVPQFINVEIMYNQKDPVLSGFNQGIYQAIKLKTLQSMIGRSAPL